ncbi:MAG: hypothetical protein V7603_4797 [Micromonosporaceae bacterium]
MFLNRRPAVDPRDGGFTLIELLVAVTVLAVIVVPLANVIIGYGHSTGATADRFALSHDAQISAAYFAQDVAATGLRDYSSTLDGNGDIPFLASIQLGAAYNAGGRTCGTAATPPAKIRFLADDWDATASTPVLGTDIVAYYVSGTQLHRMRCAGSATPVSDIVLSHNLDPATPLVTCSSTCTGTPVPQQVTLAFSVVLTSVGGYPVTLIGTRRQT